MFEVENSLMKNRWVVAPAEQDIIDRIAHQHGLPEIIARLLAARQVKPDEVEAFLYPRLARDFPDPFSLAGMPDLADFIVRAITDGRKIAVFGDFDVDGATSAAVLVRFFRSLGIQTPFYIPDRMAEGYGPNINALRKLENEGADIVILADCGITAHDVIAQARNIGLDIVVLDHHEPEGELPEATHIVNPKRHDDTSGLTMLAACGVSFLTCVAINARLRESGYYARKNIAEPSVKSWLDIVALGTVCDMVPLTGVNRLFVRQGLALMNERQNPGIKALLDVAKVNGLPSPYTLGFALGPRINAGGRVHQADLGARLLITDDAEEAKNIAWTLNDCNDKRKDIERAMIAEATGMVEARALDKNPIIIVGSEAWHPGLAGLVAGRIKEKYGKSAVVITYAPGEGGRPEGRGSGRSVPGINMAAAFQDARAAGLLLKGGGHAMAGGFTLLPEQEDAFKVFLMDHIERQAAGQASLAETLIDGILSVRGTQLDFVKLIHDHMGPFGQGHVEPLFALSTVRVHMADIVGADHVRCQVSDWEGGARLKAVAFRSADTDLGRVLLDRGRGQPVHLAGHLKINEWQGRESVEMHIQDGAFAMEGAAAAKKLA